VAEAHVPRVERLRVAALQALEPAGEVGLGAVQDEVVVRRHQAQRVHRPPVPLGTHPQVGEERAPVVVVTEDCAPVDPARDDVEVPVGETGAKNARHDDQ
jgi:hypothetical protein